MYLRISTQDDQHEAVLGSEEIVWTPRKKKLFGHLEKEHVNYKGKKIRLPIVFLPHNALSQKEKE